MLQNRNKVVAEASGQFETAHTSFDACSDNVYFKTGASDAFSVIGPLVSGNYTLINKILQILYFANIGFHFAPKSSTLEL